MRWYKNLVCLFIFTFALSPAIQHTDILYATALTPQISNSSITYATTKPSTKITLVKLTSPIAHGKTATIEIKGIAKTKYSISVLYSSGYSTAAGLTSKTSDSKGYVTWSWIVGTRTKAGKHLITISGGGQTYNTYFTTT